MSFVIVVNFKIKPGQMTAFRNLMDENARASVRDEPGCSRFDVVVPEGEPDRILLYEIYDDAHAFEAHMATPHYASFSAAGGDMLASKVIVLGTLAYAGSDG